jgi:hypothetical protein
MYKSGSSSKNTATSGCRNSFSCTAVAPHCMRLRNGEPNRFCFYCRIARDQAELFWEDGAIRQIAENANIIGMLT